MLDPIEVTTSAVDVGVATGAVSTIVELDVVKSTELAVASVDALLVLDG